MQFHMNVGQYVKTRRKDDESLYNSIQYKIVFLHAKYADRFLAVTLDIHVLNDTLQ